MSADVNIVIEAQDKASVVLEQVAKSVDENVKQIKGVGETTKKSTELVGQLANALGDTGLGAYAGQFAALTEKVSSFSDVMKAGNGGALAFKAGLIGLVAVISYKVGSAIGNAIFQTEMWERKLREATERSKELNSALAASASNRFTNAQEDIALIQDPAGKKAAQKELFDSLTQDLIGVEAKVKQSRAEVEIWNEAWFDFMGANKIRKEQANDNLEADEAQLKLLQEQRTELERLMGVRAEENAAIAKANAEAARGQQFIDGLKSEIELLKAKSDELNTIAAANATANLSQATYAEQLLNERDALKSQQERSAEIDKTVEGLKRQLEVEKANAEALKQNALLADAGGAGEEAVRRQEQLALATNDAERQRIELLHKQIDAQKEQNEQVEKLRTLEAELADASKADMERLAQEASDKAKALANVQPGVNATESRLLTRGPAEKGIEKVAKNTEKTVEKLQELTVSVQNLRFRMDLPELEFIN